MQMNDTDPRGLATIAQGQTGEPRRKTIGLSMIVKDEAHVILRCLESVRRLIDYALIVDTGSTDGTQKVIEQYLAGEGLVGAVIDEPWRDFAYNRSFALQELRKISWIDYALIIDADDRFEFSEGFDAGAFKAGLRHDIYDVAIADSGVIYRRPQLFRNDLPFLFKGVLHEYLEAPSEARERTLATGFQLHRIGGGARSLNTRKFQDDAAVLERALAAETDPFLISRYTFYLAQSYRDCGDKKNSLAQYLKRAELGYWNQEVFYSLYQAAKLKEELDGDADEVIAVYLSAFEAVPNRAEALHGASRLCRNRGRNQQGYEIAKRGLDLLPPEDGLFVEQWIYDYALRDEFALNAYWAGHHQEGLDAWLYLLKSERLPEGERTRIAANAQFAADQLAKPQQPFDDVKLTAADVDPQPSALAMPAILSAPVVSGLVSIITPTGGRSAFLRKAQTYVRHQDYADIEWLILDDSPAGHESCDDLAGANVVYERIDTRLSIGEKRNRLIDRAKGEFIVQFDDDDYYAPNYVSTMLAALVGGEADLINLRGWYLYDLRWRFFGYWNLEHKLGPHYRCDRNGVAMMVFTPENNAGFADAHFGYGFSYVFRKKVWEKAPFPDRDWNEDAEFALRANTEFRVGGVFDTKGICLHVLHPGSTSRCFPQYHLPTDLLASVLPGYADNRASAAAPPLPPTHVINLDRSKSRLAQFRQRNPQLTRVTRFPAIDGALVDRQHLIEAGVMLEDCPYSAGTLGCALSHIELWKKARDEGRPITVFEDDAVAVAGFDERAARLLATLPAEWDFVAWGFIERLDIWLDLEGSGAFTRLSRRQRTSTPFADRNPSLLRLRGMYGALAYSVSPRGAGRLLEVCLPLRHRVVQLPGARYRDEGIDGPMNDAYPRMESYICLPPLARHEPPGEAPSDRMMIDASTGIADAKTAKRAAAASGKTPPAPAVAPAPPFVFIHAAPRTSGTWFWAKFRENPSTLCYYEPFNLFQATMSAETASSWASSTWLSRHSPTDPYFREFIPLLDEHGGVRLFDPAMTTEWNIPIDGLRGALRARETQYLSLLLDHARETGKTAVIKDVNSLGRCWALKNELGGSHIFLYRNLWQQWLSYLSYGERGFPHFYRSILDQVLRDDDPYFAALAQLGLSYAGDTAVAGAVSGDEAKARLLENLPKHRMFSLFMGLHVYLYLHAELSTDLTVDVTRMAREESYRVEIERAVERQTGLAVAFADVEDVAPPAGVEIDAAAIDWTEIREYAQRAAEALSRYGDRAQLAERATALVDEAIVEAARSAAVLPTLDASARIALVNIAPADPDSPRAWFELAERERNAGRLAEAASAYARRVEMDGGDAAEAWYSRFQEALCFWHLGDEDTFVCRMLDVSNRRPDRAEPLYHLARYYRGRGMYETAMLFAEAGLALDRPEEDAGLVEDFVYRWGLREEMSIAGFYCRDPARRERGGAACRWLAAAPDIPPEKREHARRNLQFYDSKAQTPAE